jgi:hypothetical protein
MKKFLAPALLFLVSPVAMGQISTVNDLRPLTGSQAEAAAIDLCRSPAARPGQAEGSLNGYCEALSFAQAPNTPIPFNQASYDRLVGQVLAEGQRRGLLR